VSSNSLLLALALAKVALHLAVIRGYGIFRDEMYLVDCARRLAWGYVDHPPLSPAMLRVTLATLGDAVFAIRLPAALAGGALVFLTGWITRELGGGRFAQAFAALTVIIAPYYLVSHHIYTMNAFEPLSWMGAVAILILMLKGGSPKLWLVFGVLAGISLENKHTMLLMGFGLVLGLALTSERRRLLDPWLWLGGVAALAILLPNLLWQAQHQWPELEFMRRAEEVKNYRASAWEFLLGQVTLIGPVALPVWVAGLVWLFSPRGKRWRMFGWCYLIMLVCLLATHGKIYYLAPAYPMLLAAGAIVWERTTERRGWLRPASVALALIAGVTLAPLAIPLLPVETFIRYARAIGFTDVKTEKHESGRLPQLYADMFGWDNMAMQVASVYSALSPADRSQAAIFGQNYGEAGAIDYFGPRLGLPRAISGHNNYYLWGPGDRGAVLVVIGGRAEGARRYYEEVTAAGRILNPYAMPYETNLTIWVCRRPRQPIRDFWPQLKHYE
jgi:Dolichyl-phosphate-mannose-protein mannosyltransferase